MIINITILGDKKLLAKYQSMQSSIAEALRRKVYALTLKLEAKIKRDKLNGQVLNRITGRLAASINHEVVIQPNSVVGRVFSSGDVKYAAIHEYGGQTPPHLILPKKASVLSFKGSDGSQVFAKQVNHPGSRMPQRSFMRSSLKEMSTEISLGLKEAVLKTLRS